MPKRNVLIVMAAIVGTGLMFLVSNVDLPITRNSFVYAKTAVNIIAHGVNPLPVIADTNLSHGKPIAFSLLALPFVSIFGVNVGLKIASFMGTAFFLCVAYFFFVRLNRHAGIDSRFVPLELGLLFFGPLAFYQFWSAYPDSVFAGEVLLAFVLTDIIVFEHKRDARVHILLLGLVIYAAILTRFYGMILGIAVPVYLFLHLRQFLGRSSHIRAKVGLLVLVFLVLGGAIVLARLGMNPTLSFAVEAAMGGGYSGYLRGLTDMSGGVLISSIITFIFAVALNFHFSLFFLLRRRGSKSGNQPGWPLAPTCFAGICVLGLLPFSGTAFNMRFFLPIFPFVVVAIVSGILGTNTWTRRGIIAVYLCVAGFLTLNYNLQPFHEHFVTFNQKVSESVLTQHRRLDNLRLGRQLGFSRWIKGINGVIKPGGILYYASTYYGTATHGIIEELGIRNDIAMRYVSTPSEIPTSEKTVYLVGRWPRRSLSAVEDRFSITSLESNVFRLVPLRIEITGPMEDSFEEGEAIPLKAKTSTSSDAGMVQVEFLIDSLPIGVNTEPPYQFNWLGAAKGRYVITARVQDSRGNIALSSPVTFFVGIRALERSVATSADDAEEQVDGSIYLNSSDLEMVAQTDDNSQKSDQVLGMRFTDIRIPGGTRIKEAYLQFTVDEVSTEPTDLTIHAELAGNAVSFTEVIHDVSLRKRTSAAAKWSPEPWEVAGERSMKQRTPDLSALI